MKLATFDVGLESIIIPVNFRATWPLNICNAYTGWAKKNRTVFRLDNFVTVSPRKACSISKFSQFYREKGTKLAFQ